MQSQFHGPQSPASNLPTRAPKGACPLWPGPAVGLPGARWTQSQRRTFTPKRWDQPQTWPLKARNGSGLSAEKRGQCQRPRPSTGSSRTGQGCAVWGLLWPPSPSISLQPQGNCRAIEMGARGAHYARPVLLPLPAPPPDLALGSPVKRFQGPSPIWESGGTVRGQTAWPPSQLRL